MEPLFLFVKKAASFSFAEAVKRIIGISPLVYDDSIRGSWCHGQPWQCLQNVFLSFQALEVAGRFWVRLTGLIPFWGAN
jgi:hypothetical protein